MRLPHTEASPPLPTTTPSNSISEPPDDAKGYEERETNGHEKDTSLSFSDGGSMPLATGASRTGHCNGRRSVLGGK